MLTNDIFVSALKGNFEMLKWHLGDMTDADLLARPVPAANHANWQLGHLVKAETNILSMIGGTPPELPAAYADKYGASKATIDDPAFFLTKEELLKQFETARAASIAFAQTVTEEQLKQPAPEKMRKMVPTMADALGLLLGHTAMHVGQIQVLRRKLGKPILF